MRKNQKKKTHERRALNWLINRRRHIGLINNKNVSIDIY